ncbi:glycoside hydrolase family 31 protein [Apiospora kogelbergensis]|uniref:glycoside hydrolase family 31 protein n=1 Tax=Apiospora kogelbergensis TaxID=1337665 RepID=UPI00312CF9CB
MMKLTLAFAGVAAAATIGNRQLQGPSDPSSACPGYTASNVQQSATGLTASLKLAGDACNSFGRDLDELKLTVNYDNKDRLHVKIEDGTSIAYQVPESVFPRPDTSASVSAADAALEFSLTESPFAFAVKRKDSGEVLFDSAAAPLVFQDQYLRLRTSLPKNPNLYGLGEHTDPFKLNDTDYTRTMWSRDAYGIPYGTNLYGNHPIYFDHRVGSGTHGVFLLSSSGMDIKINQTSDGKQYLEYNVVGGIIDLYFMAGPTPTKVSQQYAQIAGLPAMMPYWGLGMHQCRYGYRDYYAIADVIANYSEANIPLETMWTDIDYMYDRAIMTTDPDRFPMDRVRQYVDVLHQRNQHYVVMVDPAVAYTTMREHNQSYGTFNTAAENGYFLYKNGSIFQGVVWPGVTAYPDWFHPRRSRVGMDIDALWIDMNEAANFNNFDADPRETEKSGGFPPQRPVLRDQPWPIAGFPAEFQPGSSPYPPDSWSYAPPWLAAPSDPNHGKKRSIDSSSSSRSHAIKRQEHVAPAPNASAIGFPRSSYELLAPKYQIKNANTVDAYGGASNKTLDTDIIHHDGHVELDVHNLYGTMMSTASRNAMLARRPNRRPLVITRSTFAGAGKHVGKWLGDNLSQWDQYRFSIGGMLAFSALYQVPMVGSDICGFGGNTTETLCARWASLGAFYTFMRNHNGDTSIPQEYYQWPLVAESARKALDKRYRLLDYIYTAMHRQTVDGTPSLNPLFFVYPGDANVAAIEHQFFYGDAVLVSPVTQENETSVAAYLPDDRFYAFDTWEKVEGAGAGIAFDNVSFTDIPLHVRGGTVLPLRVKSGYTTTDVRKEPFNLVIAPGRDGKAAGSLYLDDGDSVEQKATSEIEFAFADGKLQITGTFGYLDENNRVAQITVLDSAGPGSGAGNGKKCASYDPERRVATWKVDIKLDGTVDVSL